MGLKALLIPCVRISVGLAVLRGYVRSLAVKLLRMQDRSDLTTDSSFHRRGSEGWLVNGEQELVVQFRHLGPAPQAQ